VRTLANLARGSGGAAYDVSHGGKGKRGNPKVKEKISLDLDDVAGGAVNMTQIDIEYLLVELLILKYLQERYSQTSYATNVYLTLGSMAPRLTRLTRESLKTVPNVKFECTFRARRQKPKGDGKAGPNGKGKLKSITNEKAQGTSNSSVPKKRKRRDRISDEEENEVIIIEDDDSKESVIEDTYGDFKRIKDDSGEEEDIVDWSHSMRSKSVGPKTPSAKRQRRMATLATPSRHCT